jgi:hypothetical protein
LNRRIVRDGAAARGVGMRARTRARVDEKATMSTLEMFVARERGWEVFTRAVATRLDDAELLMTRATSRTMRDAVNAHVGRERALTLARVRLFGDPRRLDATVEPEVDDSMETFWRKAARGALGRWGLSISTETMLETIERPPSGRGDEHVKQRLMYLRNRLGCPWDRRVTASLLRKGYMSSWAWATDPTKNENPCPFDRGEPRKQTWITNHGIDPDEYFEKLKKEFTNEDERLVDVYVDEDGRTTHEGADTFREPMDDDEFDERFAARMKELATLLVEEGIIDFVSKSKFFHDALEEATKHEQDEPFGGELFKELAKK